MFTHDLIKINLIREGYLPNYPYHLISTEEMCDGFYWYLSTHYPQPKTAHSSDSITTAWETLCTAIVFYVQIMKYDSKYPIPNWVYSYMLGAVIGPKSNALDIHDLILPLGVDNLDDEFTVKQETACYEVSKSWILQTKQNTTHKITEDDIVNYHLPTSETPQDDMVKKYLSTLTFYTGKTIQLRPATIFGEPHIIKSVRLSQLSI